MEDILHRISRVERTIAAYSPRKSGNSIAPGLSRHLEYEATGVLSKDGETSRYFNEALLQQILSEELEVQSLLGSIGLDEPSTDTVAQDLQLQCLNMFPVRYGHDYGVCVSPNPWQALELWQVFRKNVDPVIKILHIPSVHAALYSALNNPGSACKNSEALFSAIYFAATTSLTATDATLLLGVPKAQSLKNFRESMEQALAAANFLDRPAIASLQALTLYLASLRVYDSSRSGWALNGLALRLAQSLGLHRDGKKFSLSPLESELRRRLWWHICIPEGRSMENHGVGLGEISDTSDTSLPLNINDVDLSCDLWTLPLPRIGWSEMSFSLLNAEALRSFRYISMLNDSSPPDAAVDMSLRRDNIQELLRHLEDTYIKCCDEAIPIQRATAMTARLLIAKLKFSATQRLLHQTSRIMYSDQLHDQACSILELNAELQADDLISGFRWYFRSFVQYSAMTYVLGHLCAAPRTEGARRAWCLLEDSFRIIENSDISHEFGPKWTFLKLLKGKALKARQECEASASPHEVAFLDSADISMQGLSMEAMMEPTANDLAAIFGWSGTAPFDF
ncbi:fungal-specific transcription factor domain-containing protein [Aspergillus nidulans var. acristatus]